MQRNPKRSLAGAAPELRAHVGAAGQVGQSPGTGLAAGGRRAALGRQHLGQQRQAAAGSHLALRLLAVASDVAVWGGVGGKGDC